MVPVFKRATAHIDDGPRTAAAGRSFLLSVVKSKFRCLTIRDKTSDLRQCGLGGNLSYLAEFSEQRVGLRECAGRHQRGTRGRLPDCKRPASGVAPDQAALVTDAFLEEGEPALHERVQEMRSGTNTGRSRSRRAVIRGFGPQGGLRAPSPYWWSGADVHDSRHYYVSPWHLDLLNFARYRRVTG